MKKVKILCVCGSGVVSSSMVASKLKDMLAEHGYLTETVESSPNSIESDLGGNHFDLMVCVSPVYQEYNIPKVSGVGLLTGLGEEEVIEECLEILSKLD
ncbi:PTS fructose transporter subunit IIB [Alkalibaculum sp. M08DMB]|uniref:PTS fructose transporter subunit IIB n=1 Tax=Alkalibaculum sporogenes TaxID=2655001 RepID=A0A6A7K9U8_9FIRM|nr:PTS fructose transporter subunit IIB [Alkalibaculum sporogenes]